MAGKRWFSSAAASSCCVLALLMVLAVDSLAGVGEEERGALVVRGPRLLGTRPCEEIYVVDEGETLHSISARCGDPDILERNPHVHDPDDVFPGLVIRITPTHADTGNRRLGAGHKCMFLSIVEFPVTDMEDQEKEGVISNIRVVSLGDPGFCSISCGVNYHPTLAPHTWELVGVRTYTSQDHFNSIGNLLVSIQRKQIYSIHDSLRGLTWPCLEAVISF